MLKKLVNANLKKTFSINDAVAKVDGAKALFKKGDNGGRGSIFLQNSVTPFIKDPIMIQIP